MVANIIRLNKLCKNILLELVEYFYRIKRKSRAGCKPKCSNKQYVDVIYHVLQNGTKWEYINWGSVSGNMYGKIYRKWCKDNIFKLTFQILVNIYKDYSLNLDDLFIDASHVKNVLGTEGIGKNHYDRFRNSTKMHICCDVSGTPVGIKISAGNEHEINFINKVIDDIPFKVEDCNLIADGGYKGDEQAKNLYRKYKMKVITPDKKNQINNLNNEKNKRKLKKRYINEGMFSWFKNFRRLRERYENKLIYFEGFVFFGACCIISNKITKVLSEWAY